MSFISPTDLKRAIGIPSTDTSQDPLLDQLAEAAGAAAERYCDREFTRRTAAELYTGNGTPNLNLKRRPVALSGLDVRVDPTRAFAADTALTYGTDYLLDLTGSDSESKSGVLILLQWPNGLLQSWPVSWGSNPSWGGLTQYGRQRIGWPQQPQTVRVSYAAGPAAPPEDVVAAACTIGAWMYNFQGQGGVVSTGSYIDVSVSAQAAVDALAGGSVPALGTARSILARYREIPFWGGV